MSKEEPIDSDIPKKRKLNAGFIFILFGFIMIAISYKPSIETVYCNAETLTPKPDVIMLGSSWCPYCYKARQYFTNKKVSYCEYNIEDDGEGQRLYSELNKAQNLPPGMPLGIPIIFIGERWLSGYDEHAIEKALSTLKPL